MEQTIFDLLYPPFKIKNTIRTIELFGGYGSQLLALKYIGADVEQWKLCEWAIKSIQAYKDLHCENDNTDYSKNLTTEEIKKYLFSKGISSNYNEPMKQEQINRLNEKQVRTIYNNIQATHNLVDIQQVKGADLEIVDRDKYTYLLTYSFPCQDLSLAGKRQLMSDTSTRSGLLWEVERILDECKELGTLPQVLLMENVIQVHGDGAVADFNKWQLKLESLGYKNYWQDMIATDYGIPQERIRCFMVSILGDYSYTFPKPIPRKLKLKDMLEDKVDKKYYLSEKLIKCLDNKKEYECGYIRSKQFRKNINREYSTTITASANCRPSDTFIKDNNGIRKLSCKEALRLMGVKDEDIDKMSKNQSDSSLYHLAGDSIVCQGVLTSIFKELL